MTVREVHSWKRMMIAARTAYRSERSALLRGDLEKALRYNTQARQNMAMAKYAQEMVKLVESTEKAAKKFVGNDKTDPVPRFYVNQLAASYGLQHTNRRLADGKKLEDFYAWAANVDFVVNTDLKGLPVGPNRLQRGAPQFTAKDITMGEFKDLMDEINTIIKFERDERKIARANAQMDLDTVADQISENVHKHTKTMPDNALGESMLKRGFTSYFTSLLKADTIIRMLDGGERGILRELIYDPIRDSTHDEARRQDTMRKDLNGILSKYYADKELVAMRKDKFKAAELNGQKVTKEFLIMMAMNVGNDSNLTRLKKGHGNLAANGKLTDADIFNALDTYLDQRDWDFVQAVWDYYETYREESFSLEERMKGIRPTRIEAAPFKTKFGKYRGGYFPAIYDSSKSAKVPQGADPVGDARKVAQSIPIVEHGSTKERAGDGLGAPLLLEMDVISRTLSDTIHNLAFRENVRKVSKILRNDKVREAISSTAGVAQYKELTSWLKDVASGSSGDDTLGWMSNAFRWARSSVSLYAMGFSLTTGIQQFTGLTVTSTEIGTKHALSGGFTVAKCLSSGKIGDLLSETSLRSKVMAGRMVKQDRDLAYVNQRFITNKGKILEVPREWAFKHICFIQFCTIDLPTWWGAYEKGLVDFGNDEKKAARYADDVVTRTQGGGDIMDQPSIMRGSEAKKLFTQFYSYMNSMLQMSYLRGAELKRRPSMKTAAEAAHFVLVGIVLSNTMAELLAGRGPDEDEDWAEWFLKINIMFPLGMLPGIRDVSSFINGYGYSLSPSARGIESILMAGKVLLDEAGNAFDPYEEVDAKRATLAAMKGAGYAARAPQLGAQAHRMVKGLWDYFDGTDPEFDASKILLGRK